MNQHPTKDILERFSCFLVGGEKRNSGHKILLESLFLLRGQIFDLQSNNDLNIFSKGEIKKSESISSQKKVNSCKSKISYKEGFQKQGKTVRQFLCLPYISLVKDNEKILPHLDLLKTSKKANEKKTVTSFQQDKQFEKTLQKKVTVKKGQQEKSKIDQRLSSTESLLSKFLCVQSIENAKPILETRKIRKGRMTYKVPLVTSSKRQEGKAISLLIENANFRKKNELKRPGSSFGDNDSTFHRIASGENFQNKSHFNIPLLYACQTSVSQPLATNTSYEKKLLILPPFYQSVDKNTKKIVSNKKQGFLRSKFSKEGLIDKNVFLMLPEKKHFLSILRKPNVKYCLSEELLDSVNGKGGSIEKKKQLHNLALQNRAYQHFRWW